MTEPCEHRWVIVRRPSWRRLSERPPETKRSRPAATGRGPSFTYSLTAKGSTLMRQFTGTDDTAGVEYLLTLYPDGTGEIATRAAGWPGSWGPPIAVQPVADQPAAVSL